MTWARLWIIYLVLASANACSLVSTPAPANGQPATPASAAMLRDFEQQIAEKLIDNLDQLLATHATYRDKSSKPSLLPIRNTLRELTSLDESLLTTGQVRRRHHYQLYFQELEFRQTNNSASNVKGATKPDLSFLTLVTGLDPETVINMLNRELSRIESLLTRYPGPENLYSSLEFRVNSDQPNNHAQLALSLIALNISDIQPILPQWFLMPELPDLEILAKENAGELPVLYIPGNVMVDVNLLLELPAAEFLHLTYQYSLPGMHLQATYRSGYRGRILEAFVHGWGIYASGLPAMHHYFDDKAAFATFLYHRRLLILLALADYRQLTSPTPFQTNPLLSHGLPYPVTYLDRYWQWQSEQPGLPLASLVVALVLEQQRAHSNTGMRKFHQDILEGKWLLASELKDNLN